MTAPERLMKLHGVLIIPPPQPLKEEQKHTSCAERAVMIDAFVAMHMRSDAASAPANAQQHPQLDLCEYECECECECERDEDEEA